MGRELRMAASVLIFGCATAWGQAGSKVSLNYFPQPRPHVTVTNNYSSPVTGLLIVTLEPKPGGRGGGREMGGLDTGVNWPHDRSLAPGESLSLNVGHFLGVDPSTLHPQLAAAVFADGTSIGGPEWVHEIRARWIDTFNEIAKVQAVLSRAAGTGVGKDALVASLQQMKAGLAGEPTLEKVASSLAIDRAIVNLQRAPVEGVVGDPQKTIPMLLTNFSQWRGVLEPLLASPKQPSGAQ